MEGNFQTILLTENFKSKAYVDIFDYFVSHLKELCLFFDGRLEKVIVKLWNSWYLFEGVSEDKMKIYMQKLEPFFEHVREIVDKEFSHSDLMCDIYGYQLVPVKRDHYEMRRLDKYLSYILIKISNEVNLAEIDTFDEFNVFLDALNV